MGQRKFDGAGTIESKPETLSGRVRPNSEMRSRVVLEQTGEGSRGKTHLRQIYGTH